MRDLYNDMPLSLAIADSVNKFLVLSMVTYIFSTMLHYRYVQPLTKEAIDVYRRGLLSNEVNELLSRQKIKYRIEGFFTRREDGRHTGSSRFLTKSKNRIIILLFCFFIKRF